MLEKNKYCVVIYYSLFITMSGHSKWHSIKHKKAATDAKKGKILTKHSKILMVVGRNDPNPDTNASLRAAIANAKADSVPKDNIERLLKKMAGADKDAAQFSEQIYEGFCPGGVPFVITAITDKPMRTMPEVRSAVSKAGGTFGSTGTVMFMFDHVGIVMVKNNGRSEEALFEAVIEAGGEDLNYDEEESEIVTKFEDLAKVRDALPDLGIEVKKAELQYRAKDPKIIADEKEIERLEAFIERVEEVDDVDEVFVGFDIN